MKGGMGALFVVIAVLAVVTTVCRTLGDNDEGSIQDAVQQATAAMGVEDVEIESVDVRGDRAIATITFKENGEIGRAIVVVMKANGGWTADPTQFGAD